MKLLITRRLPEPVLDPLPPEFDVPLRADTRPPRRGAPPPPGALNPRERERAHKTRARAVAFERSLSYRAGAGPSRPSAL
mgnify:CR=1 FL=1